ncbi:MAG: Plug domain-containing protein [Burkholderiaceae bacterium]
MADSLRLLLSLAWLSLLLACPATAATIDDHASPGPAASPPLQLATNDLFALPIEQLMQVKVDAASGYSQSASEVASAPQVIDRSDIATFGYRSLQQIIGAFTGVWIQEDGYYARIGVRGFLRPADFNARILLLVDGQRANEIQFDSMGVGSDALIDVDLIERVEFIPGRARRSTAATR